MITWILSLQDLSMPVWFAISTLGMRHRSPLIMIIKIYITKSE